MHRAAAVIVVTAALGIAACGDSCRDYSDFSCSYLQKATYTVIFAHPNSDRSETIGVVDGLQACGATARTYAASKQMSSASWGYVCCLHAKDSDCYEKHR